MLFLEESFSITGNTEEDTSYWMRLYAVCREKNKRSASFKKETPPIVDTQEVLGIIH